MSKIIIEADNVDDLYSIMKQLLGGGGGNTLVAASHAHKHEAKEPAAPKPEPQAAATLTTTAATTEAKPDKMAAARAAKAAKSQTTQPQAQTSEPAAQQAAAAKPTTAAAATPVGLPELPDGIRGTSSMRDLLTWLSEHGINSVDSMVATCIALKDQVPILGKVPDVETRVKRAVEVLGLFATEEAEASA